MQNLRILLVCIGTLCLIASSNGATEADLQRVLQQIQGKLTEVENHLSTLKQKLKEAYQSSDKYKHGEVPQLLPADQPHRQPGNRPAPAHPQTRDKRDTKDVHHSHRDSQRWQDFKNSLTPEQLQAIKNHYSKSSLIEEILKQRPVPTLYKRSHTELSPEMENYYKHLTPEQQELLKKYPSQGSRLGQAVQDAKHPVPEEEALEKKEYNTETDWATVIQDLWTHINAMKDITKRAQHERGTYYSEEAADKIREDIKKAKESGVKLEDLLNSLSHNKGLPKTGGK